MRDGTCVRCSFAQSIVLGIAIAVGTWSGAVTAQGGTGTIRGTVSTKAKPAATTIKVTSDERVCGSSVPDEALIVSATGRVANAVVLIGGTKGTGAHPTVITNRKCAFAPRVQAAAPKSTATVTSEDDLLHNTHAYDEKDYSLFNIALPKPGLRINRPIRDAGVVTVKCDVHPWMRGFVIVSDELNAVTTTDGSFEIPDVPAGSHQVRIWHEGLKAAPKTVTVAPGQTTTVAFVLDKS
ncbi:MAG: carboxypeptidase regulatory-like domain-containing protein [Vicinamibacterales bacterium]